MKKTNYVFIIFFIFWPYLNQRVGVYCTTLSSGSQVSTEWLCPLCGLAPALAPGHTILLPEFVCQCPAPVSLHCSYCTTTRYFKPKYSLRLKLTVLVENIQFHSILPMWYSEGVCDDLVVSVWASHDLGKCWAKFSAPVSAGDTSHSHFELESNSDLEEVQ